MEKCSICHEELNNNYITINCSHKFHKKCLGEYINHNIENDIKFNLCPLCKKFISVNVKEINNVRVVSFNNISTFISVLSNFGIILFMIYNGSRNMCNMS